MRAMILAAGLGSRMQPLSDLRAKPALPILGMPLIAILLELLRAHGVRDVLINLHASADSIRQAVTAFAPDGMQIHWSLERQPLGTGGGIRRAASFLSKSEACIVLAGDMLLDIDLGAALERHRQRGARISLLLRDDPRSARFGSIGIDAHARVRRIGSRFDLGAESAAGLFPSVRIFSRSALRNWPRAKAFEDLSDWIAPQLEAGADDIYGDLLGAGDCTWEPVGTPREYLRANLETPRLRYLGEAELLRRSGARRFGDAVIGSGARIPSSTSVRRCVVWQGETLPANERFVDGVYACGTFHACGGEPTEPRGEARK